MAKTIIHIEDNPDFRRQVCEALSGLEGVELRAYGSLVDFYRAPSNHADLYIADRHFPRDSRDKTNDNNWRTLAKYVQSLNPDARIVLLSNYPPQERDWRRYRNIFQVFRKGDFDPAFFRESIASLLGINGGKL